jgi:hypothetical protein
MSLLGTEIGLPVIKTTTTMSLSSRSKTIGSCLFSASPTSKTHGLEILRRVSKKPKGADVAAPSCQPFMVPPLFDSQLRRERTSRSDSAMTDQAVVDVLRDFDQLRTAHSFPVEYLVFMSTNQANVERLELAVERGLWR